MEQRLADIAAAVGGTVEGDAELLIDGIATLEDAGPQQLSFLANPRYRRQAQASRAGAILARPGDQLPGRNVVRVADPYQALAHLLHLFAPPQEPSAGIHPTAVLGAGTRLGEDAEVQAGAVLGREVVVGKRARIMALAVVGDGAQIGDDCTLHPHVCLYPGVRLGHRVTIHAGTVVGADGFGYAAGEDIPLKVPQLGGVIIEDDVEIGAGVCIDRGTLGDTRIGRGARIDNLVQVAHNVQVGAGCLLAAQSGISGSTRLGRGVMMAGQSGIVGHVTLGDGSRVAAKSAVTKDVKAGVTVAGIPATDIGRWRRAAVAVTRLPEALRRLAALERGGADKSGTSGRGDD